MEEDGDEEESANDNELIDANVNTVKEMCVDVKHKHKTKVKKLCKTILRQVWLFNYHTLCMWLHVLCRNHNVYLLVLFPGPSTIYEIEGT